MLGAAATVWLIPETMGKDADVLDFEVWQRELGKTLASARNGTLNRNGNGVGHGRGEH